jgi:hypothetical protein
MKLVVLKILLAATALAGGGFVHAQSVAVRVGTTGAGLEVGSAIGSHVGVRANLLGGSISHDLTESGIRYDGKFKLSNGSVLLDLHPFAGSFRISGGLAYNNNRIDATATPETGVIVINGVAYPADQVGRLYADLSWDKASPYVGIGWGSSPGGGRGLFLTTDLGVFYQTPTVSLTGVCGPALSASMCQQLQADVRAEEVQLRDAVADAKWYPVLSIGIGYRF